MAALFFFNGLSIMSLAPRTPDIKANLNINNGTFGTLLSSISIGSIIMLFIGGQIVDRFGAKLAIRLGSTIVTITFSIMVHTKSSLIFLRAIILVSRVFLLSLISCCILFISDSILFISLLSVSVGVSLFLSSAKSKSLLNN